MASHAVLVALAGLSASGKTTLARRIMAHSAGAIHVQSDVIRKKIFGVDPNTRLPETAYSRQVTARTYKQFYQSIKTGLTAGQLVISDGVCARPEERAKLAQLAHDLEASFLGIWLEAPLNVAMKRAAQRRNDASDATPEIVQQQRTYETSVIEWPRFDTGQGLDIAFGHIISILKSYDISERIVT